MTGSDDSSSGTRPISVAELLAKNGSIGAPPVGGRRRRRRGKADAVTVAELTGEIPIIRDDDPPPPGASAAVDEQLEETDTEAVPAVDTAVDDTESHAEPQSEPAEDEAETDETEAETETAEPDAETETDEIETETDETETDEIAAVVSEEQAMKTSGDDVDDDYAEAVAEYAAQVEQRGAQPDPADAAKRPRRFGFGRQSSKKSKLSKKSKGESETAVEDAEHMSPDPPDDGDETDQLDSVADLASLPGIDVPDAEVPKTEAPPDAADSEELPSYLRSTQEPLFGGPTVADDLARRGALTAPEGVELGEADELGEDLGDDEYTRDGEPRRLSGFVNALWIIGQSIFAVLLGAGLFVAFDQLWRWNNIIALVLSVLVILGLVVAVRVVRKTEDIGSTLIAVAVGALVTLGPLALLQSG